MKRTVLLAPSIPSDGAPSVGSSDALTAAPLPPHMYTLHSQAIAMRRNATAGLLASALLTADPHFLQQSLQSRGDAWAAAMEEELRIGYSDDARVPRIALLFGSSGS